MSKTRVALALFVGFILNFALGFGSIALAWAIFGPEGAFQGDSTVASATWSGFGCFAGLIAGVIVGRVTATVARQDFRLPVALLAGLLLIIGLGSALFQLDSEPKPLPEGKSVGELTFFEAGTVATSPTWYLFVAPCAVALGLLLGGRVLLPRRD